MSTARNVKLKVIHQVFNATITSLFSFSRPGALGDSFRNKDLLDLKQLLAKEQLTKIEVIYNNHVFFDIQNSVDHIVTSLDSPVPLDPVIDKASAKIVLDKLISIIRLVQAQNKRVEAICNIVHKSAAQLQAEKGHSYWYSQTVAFFSRQSRLQGITERCISRINSVFQKLGYPEIPLVENAATMARIISNAADDSNADDLSDEDDVDQPNVGDINDHIPYRI